MFPLYAQLDDDLPDYDEAAALRLDPARFPTDHWMKRHSVPSNFVVQMPEANEEEEHEAESVISEVGQSSQPPQYESLPLETSIIG